MVSFVTVRVKAKKVPIKFNFEMNYFPLTILEDDMKIVETTLELFNAVEAKDQQEAIVDVDYGFIAPVRAAWAENDIVKYFRQNKLSGNDLNKTFHKSWEKIAKSTRLELFIHQVLHYMSTYGSDFEGEAYIPLEVLDIPEKTGTVNFILIKALSKEELVENALLMLKSGIALKQATIEKLLFVLDYYDYDFTSEDLDTIKNKEAMVVIIDRTGKVPTSPVEALRYVVYKATDSTLLIKDKKTIDLIKMSKYNPENVFRLCGYKEMATIFNRFKPLFLAFKGRCKTAINTISRMSKTAHEPMVVNPLNEVTHVLLTDCVNYRSWLDNATPYALFKALSVCHQRLQGQTSFVYQIRNGKSFAKRETFEQNEHVWEQNFDLISSYLSEKFDLKGKKFFFPDDVEYALPTSEKMFVGNVPTGTTFSGEKLVVGVYWKNAWGARDIDLSAIVLNGKIGWNSSYNHRETLMYSGDITDAPRGAVEYLWAKNNELEPSLVMSNLFSRDNYGYDGAYGYKVIVGKGDDISRKYMMNPENLMFEAKCESESNQVTFGLMFEDKGKVSFVLMNFEQGNSHVSGFSEVSEITREALTQKWTKQLTLKELIVKMGASVVEDKNDADVDLSLDKISRDTFINIFSAN